MTVRVVVARHFAAIGNRREHPMARVRRVQQELGAVIAALAGHSPPPLPVTVELHRVDWNPLDPDGLVGALKCPVDAIARVLGVDDRDRRIHLRLSQGITRDVRLVTRGRWRNVREPASTLTIVIRPWQPSDGEDALRVAPAPQPKRRRLRNP